MSNVLLAPEIRIPPITVLHLSLLLKEKLNEHKSELDLLQLV
jgi:hypothetical protein